MDHVTLKKKLSSYLSKTGRLKNVSEELLFEVLTSWEQWTGTGKDFYKSIGFTQKQMAKLIGKAKKLKREGYFGSESFKEVHVEGFDEVEFAIDTSGNKSGVGMIEVDRGKGLIIRFPSVPTLIDYLKKAG